MDEEVSNDIALKPVYQKFIKTGLGRTFITRIFSLVYLKFVVTYIDLEIQDIMIILAQSQLIIIQIGMFGISYSLTQQGINKKFSPTQFYHLSVTTGILGIPIVILSSVSISVYLQLTLIEGILYFIAVFSSYVIELAIVVNLCLLRVDRNILSRAIYSLVNSVLVPSLFVVFDNLLGILIAWVIGQFIAGIVLKSVLFELMKVRKTEIRSALSIIRFGFSLYIVALINYIIIQMDSFLLFFFFEEGETSKYYWIYRIALITEEFFLNFVLGIFPIFSKIYSRDKLEMYKQKINAIHRVMLLIATIYYTSFIIESKTIIQILLTSEFLVNYFVFQLLIISMILRLSTQIWDASIRARGETKILTKAVVVTDFIRILSLIGLIRFGAYGLAIVLFIKTLSGLIYIVIMSKSVVNYTENVRIYFFMVCSSVIALMLPKSENFVNSSIYLGFYYLIVFIVLYLLKPLYKSDISFIDSIIGKRLSKYSSILKLFSQSNSENHSVKIDSVS